MTKTKVGACPKCGGYSQFYHNVGDVNTGYCKCEMCGYQQRRTQDRETAVNQWNNAAAAKANHATKTPRNKKVWDNFEEITEVRKSDALKLVVSAATRDGFRYVIIREFYKRKQDDAWMPGRDGITVPLLAGLDKGAEFIRPFDDMIQAISAAADIAANMDLMDDEKAVWVTTKPKNKEQQ